MKKRESFNTQKFYHKRKVNRFQQKLKKFREMKIPSKNTRQSPENLK